MTAELDQIGTDREMVALATALPFIERLAAQQQRRIMAGADGLLTAGTLTGEAALAMWASLLAVDHLPNALRGRLRTHAAGLNRAVSAAMLSPRAPAGPEAV